jgi:hypothetical protein
MMQDPQHKLFYAGLVGILFISWGLIVLSGTL